MFVIRIPYWEFPAYLAPLSPNWIDSSDAAIDYFSSVLATPPSHGTLSDRDWESLSPISPGSSLFPFSQAFGCFVTLVSS